MTKLSELKTGDQLMAEDVRDPEVAAELARTAVANQLAILVIQYRVEHGLTQTALARQLGMSQPAVARLEAADHEPPWQPLPVLRTSWISLSDWILHRGLWRSFPLDHRLLAR